jgi:hypothetical protein
MPKVTTILCDCGCGTSRQQSNNWIQAEISPEAFKSWKWNDARAKRKATLFLATEECAHKMYSRWLETRMHKPPQKDEEELGNENPSEVQTEQAGRQEAAPEAVN